MDSEQLIRLVYKTRELWDPKNKFFKQKSVVAALWEEVAKEMNSDAFQVKSRWKSLKDYYRSELAKCARKSGDSASATIPSSWRFFDLLSFIKPTLGRRNSSWNLKPLSPTPQLSISIHNTGIEMAELSSDFESIDDSIIPKLECEDELSEPLAFTEPSTSQHSQSVTTTFNTQTSTTAQSRKRGRNSVQDAHNAALLELEAKKVKILERESEMDEDDDLNFLKSLLPDFRSMDRMRKLKLRLKIQQLFIDETEDEDDLNFLQSLLPDFRNMDRKRKLKLRLQIQQLIIDEIEDQAAQ